ncbi:MAG: hypothetical protein FWG50_02310 [Kiritimatiellaeota bacterium]|nr:hypothetical protein [Kiritimatiellota bacterium]
MRDEGEGEYECRVGCSEFGVGSSGLGPLREAGGERGVRRVADREDDSVECAEGVGVGGRGVGAGFQYQRRERRCCYCIWRRECGCCYCIWWCECGADAEEVLGAVVLVCAGEGGEGGAAGLVQLGGGRVAVVGVADGQRVQGPAGFAEAPEGFAHGGFGLTGLARGGEGVGEGSGHGDGGGGGDSDGDRPSRSNTASRGDGGGGGGGHGDAVG